PSDCPVWSYGEQLKDARASLDACGTPVKPKRPPFPSNTKGSVGFKNPDTRSALLRRTFTFRTKRKRGVQPCKIRQGPASVVNEPLRRPKRRHRAHCLAKGPRIVVACNLRPPEDLSDEIQGGPEDEEAPDPPV